MAKKKRTLVWIRWFDASYQRGECNPSDLIPRVEIESAGLLVQETQEAVSIALDRYEHDDIWRYIQHIPRVNILKMKKIQV